MKTVIKCSHLPPSTNELFVNVRGKGRCKTERYKSWQQAAGYDFNKCHDVWDVPVYLTIALGKMRGNADASNRIKAIEDLLVTHKIIPGDSIQWVKGVNCYVAQVPFDGFEVSITPADIADASSLSRPSRPKTDTTRKAA